MRLEQIRTKDMEAQVELEARLALEAIESAGGQVKTAAEGLRLADNELAQARRRYEAGVTTSLEITDAQARLERARENRIAALVSYNAAQIDLNTALGRAQESAPGARLRVEDAGGAVSVVADQEVAAPVPILRGITVTLTQSVVVPKEWG